MSSEIWNGEHLTSFICLELPDYLDIKKFCLVFSNFKLAMLLHVFIEPKFLVCTDRLLIVQKGVGNFKVCTGSLTQKVKLISHNSLMEH